jgi:hypothetical protein
VAFVISHHSHEINNLVNGTREEWLFTTAISDPNFYLIFIFGAIPLFLVKMLVPYLYDAYNNSSLELVSTKRFKEVENYRSKINEIDSTLLTKRSDLQEIKNKLNDLSNEHDSLNNELLGIEQSHDKKLLSLKETVAERLLQASKIYNSFISDIESGNNVFLGRIVRQRLTPFKAGYVQFYNQLYSPNYASKFIAELEKSETEWLAENFK